MMGSFLVSGAFYRRLITSIPLAAKTRNPCANEVVSIAAC
jgi:hypothetical protein